MRFADLNPTFFRSQYQYYVQRHQEITASYTESKNPGEAEIVAEVNEEFALLHHAIGSAPDVVRHHLEAWAEHFLIFLGAPPEIKHPPTRVILPEGAPLPASLAEIAANPPEGVQVIRDTSMTNSKDTMRALCAALVAGKRETAVQIAKLLADAPDASYIGPNSEICTPDEQRLAYSFKYLILGDRKEALAQWWKLRPASPGNAARGKMVHALIRGDSNGLVAALRQLTPWCDTERRKDPTEWNLFLEIVGLGIAAEAARMTLLDLRAPPVSSPYLPFELIAPMA